MKDNYAGMPIKLYYAKDRNNDLAMEFRARTIYEAKTMAEKYMRDNGSDWIEIVSDENGMTMELSL